MSYGEIIINRPTTKLNRTFTYQIPSEFHNVRVGTRVLVPLGRQKEQGIVVAMKDHLEEVSYKVKPILDVLDVEPWFTEEMLQTALRMSQYYLCGYAETLRLFTIDKKLTSYDRPKEKWLIPEEGFSVEQFSQLKKKQRELARLLITEGPYSLTELLQKGFSRLVINQVMKEPNLRVELRYTSTKSAYEKQETRQIPLTEAQQVCTDAIESAVKARNFQPFLLHGVTGSGKTQVYMHAAQQCLEAGRICLVLVPEIVLTNQIVERFVSYFGEEVVLFHSKITPSQRYNNWERIRRKDSHIVIGARSAIFAPTDDIGLIILDEEHDPSYKQEDMVRYHARQVALWRGEAHSCPVVLGSATPSIESYYRAQQGQYQLLQLPHRIHEQPMPDVKIVDMKEEAFFNNYSVFSEALRTLIRKVVAADEQMIMLLNRRGHSTFILCRDCGEAITCPHCDVSMVYHMNGGDDEALQCHYCDHEEPLPQVCPHCGSNKIRYFRPGTEQVEATLRKEFPQAKIGRLDQDVASKKGYVEDLLGRFRRGEFHILLGTQMVSKGHDFPNVTGVGVITADSVLNIPIYTAAERTFNLLMQTAGRAGRGAKPGQVVIQTYNPTHYAIVNSKDHDYEGFYEEEIQQRRLFNYAPIGQMLHLVVQMKSEEESLQEAQRISDELRRMSQELYAPQGGLSEGGPALTDLQALLATPSGVEVLGPYEGGLRRVRGLYRNSIMVRGADLTKIKEYIYQSWMFTADYVYIDVDPI